MVSFDVLFNGTLKYPSYYVIVAQKLYIAQKRTVQVHVHTHRWDAASHTSNPSWSKHCFENFKAPYLPFKQKWTTSMVWACNAHLTFLAQEKHRYCLLAAWKPHSTYLELPSPTYTDSFYPKSFNAAWKFILIGVYHPLALQSPILLAKTS